MKKILLLLLFISGISEAQTINFSSQSFRSALLLSSSTNSIAKDALGNNIKIDADNNGAITVAEALAVYELNLEYASILNMTGIEFFTNLKVLNCARNSISSLNVSSLINLENLICGTTQITSLDLSNLSSLKSLTCNNGRLNSLNIQGLSSLKNVSIQNCLLSSLNVSGLSGLELLYVGGNDLTTLNLSGLLNLKQLSCLNNELTNLDFTGLPSLEYIGLSGNNLTSINLSGLDNLTDLDVRNNNISSLDVSSVSNLEVLLCSDNNLTQLDLRGLTNLKTLGASNNNLTSVQFSDMVNLSGGLNLSDNDFAFLDFSRVNFTGIEFVDISNNSPLTGLVVKNGINDSIFLMMEGIPGLSYLCADDSEVNYFQNLITTAGYSNCVINSYCSFTPGGDFNTITGKAIFDSNNNGCNALDLSQPFIKVKINDGTNQGATFSNTAGDYSFYTQAGNFSVTPEIENPTFFNVNPANAIVNFPLVDNSVSTNDFCLSANGVHPDLEIVIAPVIPARPGFEAVYKVVYKNNGNQTMSQNYGIGFFYNQHLASFVSATIAPESNIAGSLNWSYANLQPFESRSFYVTLRINAPTATNPVNINDVLIFTGSIMPQAGDENTIDNLFILNQTVVGSYDPNDIQCLQGDIVPPAEIGNYLHYLIRFENTGTDYAENIVLKNILDPSKYDLSSMQILGSSHPVNAKIQGNQAEFVFQNVNLDSGGHGNILLKLKSASTLQTGDMVSNRVSIYFDYNYPVDTNNAETVFENLSVTIPTFDNSVKIYPNPANEFVNIKASTNINSVEIYDVQGRILATSLFNETSTSLDLTKYSSGIYYLKIKTEQGSKVEKLIKK